MTKYISVVLSYANCSTCYGSPGNWYTLFRLGEASTLLSAAFPASSSYAADLSPLNLWASASFSLCTTHFGLSSHSLPLHVLLPASCAFALSPKGVWSSVAAKTTDYTPLMSSQTPWMEWVPWRHSEKCTLVFSGCWHKEFCCFLKHFAFCLLVLSIFSTVNMYYSCTLPSPTQNVKKVWSSWNITLPKAEVTCRATAIQDSGNLAKDIFWQIQGQFFGAAQTALPLGVFLSLLPLPIPEDLMPPIDLSWWKRENIMCSRTIKLPSARSQAAVCPCGSPL